MPGGESKTEKATPKRKKDERKKGNIFQSKDVVTAFFLILTFFALKFLAPFMLDRLENLTASSLTGFDTITTLTVGHTLYLLRNGMVTMLLVSLPILLVSGLVTVVFTGIQTRFLVSKDAVKPKFSRINPFSGIKKLVSIRSMVELLKSLIKIIIVAAIIYNQLVKRIWDLPRLYEMGLIQSMAYVGSAVLSTVVAVGGVFVFISALDYFYQWWEYERNLKMSKQEVKQEYKQTEGDPHVKGRIKEKQRAMSQRRMMQQVPQADVIIRNPTHFAVALRYDATKNNAPVVVAKGVDHLALRIIELGAANQVYIETNPPLARALYQACELEREIPPDFFQVVAEILAAIYHLRQQQPANRSQ